MQPAQGSNDMERWTDLRSHVNDVSLVTAGQYASWPVAGHAASVPYRAFRVLLIGRNASGSQPHTIALSSIELYGYHYLNAPLESHP